MKRLAAIALILAAPAGARPIEAEGVANIAGADVADARARAIADALEQAVAQGGLKIDARAETVAGVVTSDRLSTAATGNVTAHKILTEWRDRDLYHVKVEAEVVAEAPARCAAPAPLHMLAVAVDADAALDPAVGGPLAQRISDDMSAALGRAGVRVGDIAREATGLPDLRRSSERYNALFTADPLPTAGQMLATTLRLERREARRGTPFTGVPGEKLQATLVVDLIDAGTRQPIARVAARRVYNLTSPVLDLLPYGFQPSQMLRVPDLAGLAADAARQVAALPAACGPLSVAVVGGTRGSVTLGAGTADGVAKGSLLKIGDGQPHDDRGGWSVVQVTEASDHRATARPVDPRDGARVQLAKAATQLP